MMKCTCDICGKLIFTAPFGGFAVAAQESTNSRNTMRIATRSKDGVGARYDDICGECSDGILAFIESRKESCK